MIRLGLHASILALVLAGCGGAGRGARGSRRGAPANFPVAVVARIEGVAQCPHLLGSDGPWLLTRIGRNAIAQRMEADGSMGEPISGLGESQTPEGRSSLAYCAVPSPDGRRIAYTVTSPTGWYNVEVRDIDGGSPTRLGAGVSPAWSPDGARVAFLTFGEEEPPAIVLADPSTGRRVGTVAAPEGTVLASPPAFSPDGTRIAFSAGPVEGASEFDLYVAPTDGGSAVKRTLGGAWNLSPTWSPDGQYLVYHSKEQGGSDLWAVPVEDGEPFALLRTPEDESDAVAWGRGLRWVAALRGTSDVFLYELGSSGQPEVIAETPAEERAAAVTAGHDVVVVRWTDDDSDLWAQPLEGGDAWPLVEGPTRDGFAAVDPGGTVVAFLRTQGDRTDVWLTSLERGDPRPLTTDGSVRDGSPPRVSPDGRSVLYVVLGEEKDTLFVQPVDGGPRVRLIDEPETYAWDPSGNRVVVSVYERDEPRLYRVRPDGRGRKERLQGDLEGLVLLGILPGGTHALTLDESDAPRIVRFDLRTGRSTVELTLPGNADPASVSVAIDPDGRHVVIGQHLIRSEVREVADLSALIAAATR